MALMVGLSYAPASASYPNYAKAVLAAAARAGLAVETVDLAAHPRRIETIDAIVFTGGPDVEPKRYGFSDVEGVCETEPARDEAESVLLERASTRGLALLAICRGAQLLNVFHGGTLIADLPREPLDHRKDGRDDRWHAVTVTPGSLLHRCSGIEYGLVNSAHHQAVDRIADPFRIVARADDGTVEAYEWRESAAKPPLLAVQWHPERMAQSAAFAGPLFDWLASVASPVGAR